MFGRGFFMQQEISFEIWRFIKGFDNRYAVSNYGRVKSYVMDVNGLIMFPTFTRKKYLKVNLRLNGRSLTRLVHRLVAEAFIDNPNNLPQVNHLDIIKTNNYKWNLEWSTNWENSIHYQDTIKLDTKYPRGVAYHPKNKVNKYVAVTVVGDKTIYIGSFKDPISAGNAYTEYSLANR